MISTAVADQATDGPHGLLVADRIRAADWVEGINRGDPCAFESMFRAHHQQLCALALRIVASSDAAEDVVQEVFLRIWEHRGTWKPQSVSGYLHKAVRNRALNHLRYGSVRQRFQECMAFEDRPTGVLPDASAQEAEIRAAVRDAVERLPPRCRRVFLLSRQDGRSYSQIADLLHISIRTVETQMRRALFALRDSLAVHLT